MASSFYLPAVVGILSRIFLESIPPVVPPLSLLLLFASYFYRRDAKRSHRKFIGLLLIPIMPLFLVSIADEFRYRYRHADFSNRIDNAETEYALVTGASSGIGRAIAIQLARRGISLVLVARDKRTEDKPIDDLEVLAKDIKSDFGVSVETIRADFSIPGEARKVYQATTAANLTIVQLVLAAGWGPTKSHILLGDDEETIESVIRINVESTAVLSSLYGKDMAALVQNRPTAAGGDTSTAAHLPPHILIVSSVMGTVAGLPNAALYAATKAFGRSLAQGISLEMEALGVGVTTLCPGATATKFGLISGMTDAAVWNFPLTISDPDDVAESAVRSMLSGGGFVMPNFMNYIVFHIFTPLVPSRIAMMFYKFCWEPWPFSFPPGWRPPVAGTDMQNDVGNKGEL